VRALGQSGWASLSVTVNQREKEKTDPGRGIYTSALSPRE